MHDDSTKTSFSAGPNAVWAGYLVHAFTALGAVIALSAVGAIFNSNYRLAFLLMAAAVVIDAVDGTLARAVRVAEVCPQIDGRKLDDIVDYLNYSFVPILLLCHAGWLPEPTWCWAAIPLITSLFGFAHVGAKEEAAGFFRGFPSYWNVAVFYIAVWLSAYGAPVVLAVVLGLSLLTVLPVRFVYPNRPPCWLPLFAGGGCIWLLILVVLFLQYPDVSQWLLLLSGIYPIMYVVLSVYLDIAWRRRQSSSRMEIPR